MLWDKLELPELKRTNSSERPASEANVGDALYKLDISADNQLYNVDSMGIGRLPRFNNNNNIYLKSSIQTSSIDYKKYNDIYN